MSSYDVFSFLWPHEGHTFGLSKDKSFSILYADGEKGNEVSLDLMAPTPVIFKYWFKGIKKILERIQDVRANSSPDDLFIKQTWENAGEDMRDNLTVQMTSTSAIHVYTCLEEMITRNFRILQVLKWTMK